MIIVGIGEDSHRFTEKNNKKLMLGGIEINHPFGFEGNSDGDVILHSLCNAFDVVTDLGSLSVYSDPMSASGQTESYAYLEYILKKAIEKNFHPISISISVEAKEPKMEKYRKKMINQLKKIFQNKSIMIGLTFTSGEELTDFGKGLGVRATSIITFKKD